MAVTGAGSELDRYAEKNGWLARFPMWDWVGGRTSVMSAVGLLPRHAGPRHESFLAGAAAMDARTREAPTTGNAAMLLALMWHYAGNGRGEKDMVVLPYKDRLVLFSRYLQQLVMESLGKEKDLDGKMVNQGIAVYGNKGSTDQHAYVQQLRDGVHEFLRHLHRGAERSRRPSAFEVEHGLTSGDYLHGFLRGTRAALYENGRESITLSIPEVNAFTVGALIALYERAVGFYASLVNINAYHQPGVEAGKEGGHRRARAAAAACGKRCPRGPAGRRRRSPAALGADPEEVFHVLRISRQMIRDRRDGRARHAGGEKFFRVR